MEYRLFFTVTLYIVRTTPAFLAAVFGFLETVGIEWVAILLWCFLIATTVGFIAPFILWIVRYHIQLVLSFFGPAVQWLLRSILEALVRIFYYVVHYWMTLLHWTILVNLSQNIRLAIYDLLGVPELIPNETRRGRCCGINATAHANGQYRCTEIGTIEIGRGKFCRRHTAQGRARQALENPVNLA